jgi:hypothetical protein
MLLLRFVPAWLLAALFLLAGAGIATAQPWESPARPPMPLMTDTPEYCFYLAGRFMTLQRTVANPSSDARVLAFEGRRMCEQGLVIPGIKRVRRALMILRAER